ncbi:MAG TPA: hypothetical protein VF602_13200 [Pedobacter sp.]
MTVDSLKEINNTIEAYAKNYEPSKKAIGGNLFLGTGILKGSISRYFRNPYYIGLNIDIHRKKFVFQIDDYIGFSSIKEDLNFTSDVQWTGGKPAYSFMGGLNLGYTAYDDRNFKVAPLAGMGFTILSSKLLASSERSNYEPVLAQYKIGAYIDFKSLVLLQQRTRINDEDEYYASLRLSGGVTNTIGPSKYSNFYSGSMFYVTLGMGGLSRTFKKK